LFVCFLTAIFVITIEIKFGWEAIRIYKIATNQSLNQKSRCFYIGAFVFLTPSVSDRPGPGASPPRHSLSTASLTHAGNDDLRLLTDKTTRKPDRGYRRVFETHRISAVMTYKMNMIVPVPARGTVVAAERITDSIICRRDRMDKSFFQKSLQGPIDGHPIEFLPGPFFDIAMRERSILVQEQFQDLASTAGHAQLIAFEYIVYLFFH
jgi:hypothetical protein